MRLESKELLQDVLNALELLDQFAKGKTFDDYERDPMFRAAVEREFEIVGEAFKRLADRDPETANEIPELRRIVSFRNILIHGYAKVDNAVAWEALATRVGEREHVQRIGRLMRPAAGKRAVVYELVTRGTAEVGAMRRKRRGLRSRRSHAL